MFATDGASNVVDINNWRIVASFANKHSLSKSPSQNVHTFYSESLKSSPDHALNKTSSVRENNSKPF